MLQQEKITSPQWSSRWGFILVMSGFAIGLGNVWRFPYLLGEGGGGAFIVMYLFFVFAIGVPILMAEIMLGRAGGSSPVHSMEILSSATGASPLWQLLGWMMTITGFLILSYFSVVAGWLLAYIARVAGGIFDSLDAAGVKMLFSELISDPEKIIAWHTIFMVATIIISARGVNKGLEQVLKLLVVVILILLTALVIWTMQLDTFGRGVRYLFAPNFNDMTFNNLLAAMGHAFFSLGVGIGGVMALGVYLPRTIAIGPSVVAVALIDTVVGILAGLAVFPVIFAFGLDIVGGPQLIFQVLPLAIAQLPSGGQIWVSALLLLLILAACTTAVTLLEPLISWLVEEKGVSRVWAATTVGVINWSFGIVAILSFSVWAFEFDFLGQTKSNGMFDLLDISTSHILLPLSGILICVLSAWVLSRSYSEREFGLKYGRHYELWRLATKFAAPVLVTILLLYLLFGHLLGGSN